MTAEGVELLESAAPSHVETVLRNFVEAMSPEDYAAVGRAFAAVIAVEPAADVAQAS